jgi:hypothetical protein
VRSGSDRAVDAITGLKARPRPTWVSGKLPPCLRTCSSAASKRLHPTANGSRTPPMSGPRRLALRGGHHRSISRRVVGWSMSAAMTVQLVTDALVMAIWRCGKPDASCITPIAQPIYQRAVPAADGRQWRDLPIRLRRHSRDIAAKWGGRLLTIDSEHNRRNPVKSRAARSPRGFGFNA